MLNEAEEVAQQRLRLMNRVDLKDMQNNLAVLRGVSLISRIDLLTGKGRSRTILSLVSLTCCNKDLARRHDAQLERGGRIDITAKQQD